jgi:cobalt-zinc-cadmium efflux system outer membrane protein
VRNRAPAVPFAVLAWLVASSVTAPAAQTTAPSAPLTLDAALTRALEANRTIIVARLQRPVAAAAGAVARERPNPDLTFEAARETPKQSISFSLPIELGGKRDRRFGLAEAGVATTEAEIARVVADVQNEVRHAYFQLVAAERRMQLATDARALAIRVHDAADARFTAGAAPQQEERQAQLNLVEADQDVTAAGGEAAAARAELNVLLGQPTDTPLTLTDGLTARPLPALADIIAQASQANTALAALDRRIAEQKARRDLARAMRTPDLTAGAAITYLAMPEFHVGYRASAGITLPLLTKHTAGVVLEDAELTRLGAEREATAADISAAVTAALARATAAREQMVRYDTVILPIVLDIERMAQDGYQAGQRDLVNLITALQNNKESRQRGLQASLDYQLALADLERAMGTRLR